ncbi:unnamed protein product [Bursaphelenchus xylophilus]|uniref:(pine wood nematode) hypothetical protein n=1 Tax=Bursaphelenchus xylophilus TaxID=6326 RepID=A0A7I8X7L1_BURXY|nr:unnamed protein product [Bursaphelenchus xylophilus]CAG9125919.1 unnamed protein product [Bursaphelenchus xylophilus]
MHFLKSLLIASSCIPLFFAIQCYNGNQGLYVTTTNIPTVDCGATINTCAKSVDLVGQMAYRTCGSAYSCTFANGTASPRGYCYNVSTSQTLCCCYGNLCNATTRPAFNIFYLVMPLLILLALQSRKFVF